MRATGKQRRSGFTLVELVIVMVLLTLMAAVIAPQLSGFVKGRKSEEESRRFLALTGFAREEAISRGQRLALWIAADGASYGLRVADATKDEPTDIVNFTCESNLTITPVQNEDTVVAEEGETTLIFWPDGAVDREGVIEFQLNEGARIVTDFILQPKTDLFKSEAHVDEG
ncbi:hypothetical protein BH09SUM1_BH09SUM1_14840 [soil metagenome]